MKLTIIMPCYNEKQTINQCLQRILKVNLGKIEKEIIIVDDGSNDGTREILKELHDKNIKIILHEHNHGKGYAVRTGLKHSSGNVIIIQDADLEYNPEDYKILLKELINKNADVVYGSRTALRYNKWSHITFAWGGYFLSILTNFLYGSHLTDEPTCYKMFKTKIIKSIKLTSTGFEFCPEITAKILKKGIKIYEIPISYNPRNLKEGKKIRWRDGVIAIWTLLKYKFAYNVKSYTIELPADETEIDFPALNLNNSDLIFDKNKSIETVKVSEER